jgi:putative radical SAM enzyme (TIGR03279 family)
MNHPIKQVEPGSPAHRLGLRAGDRLVSINGQKVIDFIDYQAFCCARKIRLEIERDGATAKYSIQKDQYQPLGLTFDAQLMSGVRCCANNCAFCFVDQLPEGARDTLRVKDDDWRLSLMMGNFVTLTNVGPRELERMIERHASPLYISVHTTDPELRVRLMGTKRAAEIGHQLKRLSDAGIKFHAQAVVCPGLNDGAALDRTIGDLVNLYPSARSLALVPVGLTAHRQGLAPLTGFDAAGAAALLDQVDRWRSQSKERIGTGFVQPADEFYILAGRPFPEAAQYEGYAQIENGVGMCRLLADEFEDAWREDRPAARTARLVIACGVSVAPFLEKLIAQHPIDGVSASVRPIKNHYFGPTVTVSGLLTGGDLIRGLCGVEADRILITECMLREGEDVFLDGMTLGDVKCALGRDIVPVGRRGDQLLAALTGAEMPQ